MAISPFTCFEQLTTDGLAVLNGGSVTVYLAGTTNLVSLFTVDDLTGAAANPITLDSAGRHAMRYMAAAKYKILTKDSLGNTIKTYDNIDPAVPLGTGVLAIANGGTGAATAPAAITALGGATAAEVAAIAADVAALSGTLSAVDKTHIATGTTVQRPLVPVVGDIRRNSTKSMYEAYNGSAWVPWIVGNADISSVLPTVQTFLSGSAATYTTPTGVVRIRVRMIGGGGGGGGRTANNGSNGVASAFADWTANPGSGGIASGGIGGRGGNTGTDGTGTRVVRLEGGGGSAGGQSSAANVLMAPGAGGGSALGGCNYSTHGGTLTQPANTGAGGHGGSGASTTNAGSGGGAGEYVEFWMTAAQVGASKTYTVGGGGNGGAAGGQAGGNGAAGIVIVEEFYF